MTAALLLPCRRCWEPPRQSPQLAAQRLSARRSNSATERSHGCSAGAAAPAPPPVEVVVSWHAPVQLQHMAVALRHQPHQPPLVLRQEHVAAEGGGVHLRWRRGGGWSGLRLALQPQCPAQQSSTRPASALDARADMTHQLLHGQVLHRQQHAGTRQQPPAAPRPAPPPTHKQRPAPRRTSLRATSLNLPRTSASSSARPSRPYTTRRIRWAL
jgi:hypothetical protein